MNRVGLSVADAFDPCKNLKAAGTIFNTGFQAAMQQYPEGQALQAALSAYNTGNFVQGFSNGYVGKVLRNMPDKASTVDHFPASVQPIPLANAAHKPTIAEVIRPKASVSATAQTATVTVGKPIEQAERTLSMADADKPAARIEPAINVYNDSLANGQGIMVYAR